MKLEKETGCSELPHLTLRVSGNQGIIGRSEDLRVDQATLCRQKKESSFRQAGTDGLGDIQAEVL